MIGECDLCGREMELRTIRVYGIEASACAVCRGDEMTLEDACRAVLGQTADRVMEAQGLHWAVVAALAEARVSHPKEAIAALDRHIGKARGEQ